jgi:membrane protease YdiL (CAAX protease family)
VQAAAVPSVGPPVYPVVAAPITPVYAPQPAPYAVRDMGPTSMSPVRSGAYAEATSPVVKLIGYFAAMLVTSIIFAAVIRARFEDVERLSRADRLWLLYGTLVVEAIDTLIVLVAWASLKRPANPFTSPARHTAWLAAAPGLALLLGLNFAYHAFLRSVLPSIEEPERMLAGRPWLYLVAYCVQPAIVEEFFFRGLVLDWFRSAMSTAGAVAVSSVMFALCHVYAPVGVPYLFVAGAAFGIARIASGGLALPMILHFLHNLVVMLVEHHR